MNIIPEGFEPIALGRVDMIWRENLSTIDEIKEQYKPNSVIIGYRATRFKKKDDTIIKQKMCDTVDEAVDFLNK